MMTWMERMSKQLEKLTSKVDYIEATMEDPDYEVEMDSDEENEFDQLQQDASLQEHADTGDFVAAPKGRGKRSSAGNAAHILSKTFKRR